MWNYQLVDIFYNGIHISWRNDLELLPIEIDLISFKFRVSIVHWINWYWYFPKLKLEHGWDIMMTSSNGNIFRVTGSLCGEFTSPGEFPTQRPVTRRFDVFFDLRLNKRLSKQPWGWWFETPSLSLWRQCNVTSHKKKKKNQCIMIYPNPISLRRTWCLIIWSFTFLSMAQSNLKTISQMYHWITPCSHTWSPSGESWHNNSIGRHILQLFLPHLMPTTYKAQYWLIEAEWRIYASVSSSSLVQIMACRLDGAKPLSEPMLEYC